jgi:hypothetical protein
MTTKPMPAEGKNCAQTESESALRGAACSLCGDSGTRIIGERDGENFWNRCVPCECRSNPIIPVKANDWAYLNKCARVVEWMGSHGVCWRDATNANSSWRIGDETEWLYGDGHKVIKEVEEHMEFFRANDERTCADD